MTFRAATNHTRGVRTLYVASESNPDKQDVAQHIRRSHQQRWFCDCPDFTFRRIGRRRRCKHLRQLAAMARAKHGVSRLAKAVGDDCKLAVIP